MEQRLTKQAKIYTQNKKDEDEYQDQMIKERGIRYEYKKETSAQGLIDSL